MAPYTAHLSGGTRISLLLDTEILNFRRTQGFFNSVLLSLSKVTMQTPWPMPMQIDTQFWFIKGTYTVCPDIRFELWQCDWALKQTTWLSTLSQFDRSCFSHLGSTYSFWAMLRYSVKWAQLLKTLFDCKIQWRLIILQLIAFIDHFKITSLHNEGLLSKIVLVSRFKWTVPAIRILWVIALWLSLLHWKHLFYW